MASVDRQAADIVALHDRVHGWPSHEAGIHEAFQEFLASWMPHAAEPTMHLRIPPSPAYGRAIRVLAHHDGRTTACLEINDTYRATTRPNTRKSLLAAATAGDPGRLADDALWMDPRLQGVLKMLVWWGNDGLWRHCAPGGRRASRLAFEALSGQSWEARHGAGGQGDPERAAAIRAAAERRLEALQRRPYAIPLRVLRERKGTMTQAIAHYLVKDPDGPRMGWADAARLTGTSEWRTLDSAVRALEKRSGPETP